MAQETFTFQAEVSKLLGIVARSLYSEKEIFLRELISNASDACDRLRYLSLTDPKLLEGALKITLGVDKKTKILSVSDNGIGMNREDLSETLGTIARSGTQAFVEKLSSDSDHEMELIGQFGVGFYSAFMVADRVDVLTRKAGEEGAWLWSSDGQGSFTIEDAERDGQGTTVTLHLAKGEKEFLEEPRLSHIVKSYSDHIGLPIVFIGKDGAETTLNTASALWTRTKKDITDEQYKEFYHHAAHAFDDPWMTLHNQVEGVLSYTNLLFIPSSPPFDLFDPQRKQRVKLYVRKVFITDDCEGLLPPYLRFLRGIVDSEDLSLNVSREMLQNDPKLAKIKNGLTKRVLGEIKKKAEKAPEDYATFWQNFGAVLKEGLYEDPANREKILHMARFHSTRGDGLISLDAYVEAMNEGQDAIYYITGDDLDHVTSSPQLEGFKARGVEVLLLTDPVDEFWIPSLGSHADKPFKSVTQGAADIDKITAESDAAEKKDDKAKKTPDVAPLIAVLKEALADAVKDVCVSERLTDSAVCLVAGEGDMDMRLERMMRQHQHTQGTSTRILEVNPAHPLIKRLNRLAKAKGTTIGSMTDTAHLLLDQARIVEGEPVADAAAFARRLAAMMEKGLAGATAGAKPAK
jgi:molecular chaperone HtpG